MPVDGGEASRQGAATAPLCALPGPPYSSAFPMTAPAPTEAARSAAAQPLPEPRHRDLRDMANALRALAMDAVEQAKSGHPGMPMGMADVATVLFAEHLKFDAADARWPDRDRFVLSA